MTSTETKMNSAITHPFFAKMTSSAKNECDASKIEDSTETKMNPCTECSKTSTQCCGLLNDDNKEIWVCEDCCCGKQNTKTYGRGKLRINLNSPRGNIYAIWGIAMSTMEQSGYSKEKINETLAGLRKETYEECLEAFGKHKVFGSLFKLYYSPEYIFHWDEGEWGNPDEEDSEDDY
jgi:hypothetical protein